MGKPPAIHSLPRSLGLLYDNGIAEALALIFQSPSTGDVTRSQLT